jgi:hypothetical protein
LVKKKQAGLRKAIQQSVTAKIPVTGLMSALGYFDACRAVKRMPVNLIQAQRDLFRGRMGTSGSIKEGKFSYGEWTAYTQLDLFMSKDKKIIIHHTLYFCGSGDLTNRKLIPALYNLFIDNYLPDKICGDKAWAHSFRVR